MAKWTPPCETFLEAQTQPGAGQHVRLFSVAGSDLLTLCVISLLHDLEQNPFLSATKDNLSPKRGQTWPQQTPVSLT